MDAPIILASSSPYRKVLLEKLGLTFSSISPHIDESAQPGESGRQQVERLAKEKASAVARQVESGLIIASDQLAVLDQHILGKPHTHDRALEQLKNCQGRTVTFLTGLCLLNAETGVLYSCVEPFNVHFRRLPEERLERYLHQEQPYDCAGSFKCEGLGISLFERLEGDDPNSLIGLPLIRLIHMLEQQGIFLP